MYNVGAAKKRSFKAFIKHISTLLFITSNITKSLAINPPFHTHCPKNIAIFLYIL